MASRLIKEKEQQKLQDKYMEVDKETGKLVLTGNVNTTLLPSLGNIVDSQGRQRFFDGSITTRDAEGVTTLYAKYSLSGTHLLIVQCLEITAGTTILNSWDIGSFAVPTFVMLKLQNIIGDAYVDIKQVDYFNGTIKAGEVTIALRKLGTNSVYIRFLNTTTTFTDTVRLRITFDLLIDTD